MDDDRTTEAGVDARDTIAWLINAFRPPTAEAIKTLGLRESDLDHLESEYVRLFLNSATMPVAHLEAAAWLLGEEEPPTVFMEDLSRECAALGLRVPVNSPVPPDHLTVLLELLYAKRLSGASALPSEDPFARRFLVPWVPRFLERLEAADPPSFYRRAGNVLASLLGLGRPGAVTTPERFNAEGDS